MKSVDIIWYGTEIASILLTFGMAPTLLYFRVRKKSPERRRWLLWIPFSVVVTWLFLIAFSVFAEGPALTAYAAEKGDHDADGVGGNVAVLFTGWIIPLLSSLVFAGVFTATDRRRNRANQPPQTTPVSAPR